jgi:hypothetical protein
MARAGRLLSLAIALLTPGARVVADIGPHPTEKFMMHYRIEPVAIQKGELRNCSDARCSASTPIAMFPRIDCASASCSSWGYGYPEYQKLRLTFLDGPRESNPFQKRGFNSTYLVTVYQDRLLVREIVGGYPLRFLPFGAALILTLIIELAVAAIYLARLRLLGGLVWVLVANLVSLPIVWFVFPRFDVLLDLRGLGNIAAAEVFAVIVEAILLYAAMRTKGLTVGHSVTLSLLMNAASFAVGSLVQGVVPW